MCSAGDAVAAFTPFMAWVTKWFPAAGVGRPRSAQEKVCRLHPARSAFILRDAARPVIGDPVTGLVPAIGYLAPDHVVQPRLYLPVKALLRSRVNFQYACLAAPGEVHGLHDIARLALRHQQD